jgi:hypothetical protein
MSFLTRKQKTIELPTKGMAARCSNREGQEGQGALPVLLRRVATQGEDLEEGMEEAEAEVEVGRRIQLRDMGTEKERKAQAQAKGSVTIGPAMEISLGTMLATELGIKPIIAVKAGEDLGMEVKLRIETETMAIQEVIVEGENVAEEAEEAEEVEEVDIEDEQEGREDHPNRHDVRFRPARGELFFFYFKLGHCCTDNSILQVVQSLSLGEEVHTSPQSALRFDIQSRISRNVCAGAIKISTMA